MAAAAPKLDMPHHQMQAIAFHLFTRCSEETTAFQDCMKTASKPSQECTEQLQALTACSKNLVEEAVATAKEEWHHYTKCLEIVGGKYSYCRPEKSKFDEAFPLEN